MTEDNSGENPYFEPPLPGYSDSSGFEWKEVGSMSDDELRKEMEVVKEAVEHHSELYYGLEGRPVISDSTYDELFHRLEVLEEALGVEDGSSPTRSVGTGRSPEAGR